MHCLVRIESKESIFTFLEKFGSVPIPPYFNRDAIPSDKERYNNVYAKEGGSVAAPTAGLHFTNEVLDEIGGSNRSELCLDVGAGTFKPVIQDDARKHVMHAESFAVRVDELRRMIAALKEGKPLVVVGTTSTRTLESLYWCGVKRLRGLGGDDFMELQQFEWIPLSVGNNDVSAVAALEAVVAGTEEEDGVIHGRTSLMITPNLYEFRIVDHLITNFHAPDSTLMLLVSAFHGDAGKQIKTIYEDAQEKGYRFLSYGDVCLFSRPKSNPLPSTIKSTSI